jgi:hypothetical protein
MFAAALQPSAAFHDGDFLAAQTGYTAELQQHPSDVEALFGLAQLAIYDNRLADARMWLDRAARIVPGDVRIEQDEHTIASRTDPNVDRISGSNTGPIPFVTTDPLPSVHVSVNGRPATFIIDTGAPDIVLDPQFAQTLGVAVTGERQGTFAGGLHASVEQTSVGRLQLGGWSIDHIPAVVLPVANMLGDDRPVQGVIGTALLAHFLTTLDYIHGTLTVRDPAESQSFESAASLRGAASTQLWLVGDHFLFIHAHAGLDAGGLFNIDTGGTFGVQLTQSALDNAHVALDTDETSTGMGAGGPIAFVPFTTTVSVGGLSENSVAGIYMPGGDQFGMFPFTVTGTLSQGFFRHTALTLDLRAMRVVIDR